MPVHVLWLYQFANPDVDLLIKFGNVIKNAFYFILNRIVEQYVLGIGEFRLSLSVFQGGSYLLNGHRS